MYKYIVVFNAQLYIHLDRSESNKWFIEDQTFSPWYVLAPPPPSPHIPSASCLSFSDFLFVACRGYWREKMGEGGEGAKSYDCEKAWSSINHSKRTHGRDILTWNLRPLANIKRSLCLVHIATYIVPLYHSWSMLDKSVTTGTGLTLMPECRCRTDSVKYRWKCRCRTKILLLFLICILCNIQ